MAKAKSKPMNDELTLASPDMQDKQRKAHKERQKAAMAGAG